MNSPTYSNKDEIDLMALFQKIYYKIRKLILGFFRWIVLFIIFIFKNIHFLMIAAIIGGLVGFGFYKISKRYYSSYLVARTNGISNIDMISYLNDLSKLCEENNYSSLANLLDIPDSISQKIKNIQAFWFVDVNDDNIGDYVDFQDTYNAMDTTQQRIMDRFHLKVELYDNSVFPPFKIGLYNYIKRNPYLKELNMIRQANLKELISATEKEIDKIDSLQNLEYYRIYQKPLTRSQSQITFMTEKQTQLYYRDKFELISNKQFYEQELQLGPEPITVIKDFTPLSVAENTKGKYIIRYSFVFTLLGLVSLIFIKNRKYFLGFTNL